MTLVRRRNRRQFGAEYKAEIDAETGAQFVQRASFPEMPVTMEPASHNGGRTPQHVPYSELALLRPLHLMQQYGTGVAGRVLEVELIQGPSSVTVSHDPCRKTWKRESRLGGGGHGEGGGRGGAERDEESESVS